MHALLLFVLLALCTGILACTVDLGFAGSTQCSRAALFCTHDSVSTDALSCRSCYVNPSGPLPGLSVYDPHNFCSCLPGEYCRQTGNDTLGVCAPSQLVGTQCSTDVDCEGPRERSVDGYSRRERGFCVQGRCAQCNPATFERDWGSDTHTCHGYRLNGAGERVYHTARPGTQVMCMPDGSLMTSGQVDWERQEQGTVPGSSGAVVTDDADGGDNNDSRAEDAAILSFVLIAFVCCGLPIITLLVVILVFLVRLRRVVLPPERVE